MKIGFLGPAFPIRGGIAQAITIMADKMSKNHEIKIFSFIKQYPKLIFPGKEQIDKSKMVYNLNIEPVLTPYNIFTFLPCFFKIKKWNPDVIIIRYWIPFFAPAFGIIIRLIKKFTSIKVMVIVDNIEFHEKWIMGDFLTKFALKKADILITLSQTVQLSAEKLFKKMKIKKLFHPNYDCYNYKSDLSEFKSQLEINNENILLFFGYIKPYKGLDILLEAMPEIIKEIPNIKLLIAGEVYGDDSVYYNMIKKYKLDKYVIFYNKYILNEDIHNFFDISDVVILPYRNATQSGITQLAFSFETPVIAADVGGLKEVISDGINGYLFPKENIGELVKSVTIFFLENKKEDFVLEIIKENNKYSWENFIKEINNLI